MPEMTRTHRQTQTLTLLMPTSCILFYVPVITRLCVIRFLSGCSHRPQESAALAQNQSECANVSVPGSLPLTCFSPSLFNSFKHNRPRISLSFPSYDSISDSCSHDKELFSMQAIWCILKGHVCLSSPVLIFIAEM